MGFDLENRAKPILKWAGGKSGPLPQLIKKFPSQFKRYFEPFVGGAAVFLALEPSHPATINDSNPELILLYQTLRDRPKALKEALDEMVDRYSEEYYYSLRDSKPKDPVERAARTIFLNKTGYNGLYRLNSAGGFNVPYGKREKCPSLYHRENWKAASFRLKKAEILNRDFAEVIALAKKGDFVYCDPPYEPLSLTSCFNSYTAGGFSRKEQERLRDACEKAVERGALVAVSNSTSPYISDLYQGWKTQVIRVRRMINSKASKRGAIREILISA